MTKIIYKEDNVTNINEPPLVPFIIENFGDVLYSTLKIPFSYKPIFNVKKPLIDEGDLDLLLVDSKKPQFTYEFEFKRIKIKYDIQMGETLNKLMGLKKVIHQMKKRLDMKFHKCYLVIVTVFYGNDKEANNIFFKKANSETLDKVYNSEYLKNLDKRAGIIGLEVTQPTAKNFNEQCGLSIFSIKKPMTQIQPISLTDSVERLYCK